MSHGGADNCVHYETDRTRGAPPEKGSGPSPSSLKAITELISAPESGRKSQQLVIVASGAELRIN